MAGHCTISAACDCWAAVLACSGLGFLLGLPLLGVSDNGSGHYSKYGFEFSASILAGRAYLPKPKPPRLPLIPKAVLLAFAAFTVLVLLPSPKLCSGFVAQHLVFSFGWLICGISTATWLMKASEFQGRAERERKAQLEEFLTESSAPVPNPVQKPPLTLSLWNYSNAGDTPSPRRYMIARASWARALPSSAAFRHHRANSESSCGTPLPS